MGKYEVVNLETYLARFQNYVEELKLAMLRNYIFQILIGYSKNKFGIIPGRYIKCVTVKS